MTVGARLKRMQASVDALTLRERLMLLAGVLVVMGGLWEAMLAAPLAAREAAASAEIEAATRRLEGLDEAVNLAATGIGDGMPDYLERRRALERQVAASDETVRVFTSDLVDPTQMREVLEELIERQRGLELVRASNLEVRPVLEKDTASASGSGEPVLYRHGLRLELEGSFLDCLDYLEAVERLPWQLYWGSLRLVTGDYPVNTITIEIFTLSLEEDWIGV